MCNEHSRFGWKDEDLRFIEKDMQLVAGYVGTEHLKDVARNLIKSCEQDIALLKEHEFQRARRWAKEIQGIWLW